MCKAVQDTKEEGTIFFKEKLSNVRKKDLNVSLGDDYELKQIKTIIKPYFNQIRFYKLGEFNMLWFFPFASNIYKYCFWISLKDMIQV